MSIAVGNQGAFTSEPNVVPMIDVMLVLLIIFMMQVPLQRKAMDVNLPPEQQVQQQQTEISNQIVLELSADGGYAINSEPVAFANLERRLREIFDVRPTKLMFIKTAGSRHYEDVIQSMDLARGAGVQVIGFTPSDQEGESEGG